MNLHSFSGSTIIPSYRRLHCSLLPLACGKPLRLRSREVDGWYLIVGSLVKGYM